MYYTIRYYTILYYTILYYTMLCYAMLRYAMGGRRAGEGGLCWLLLIDAGDVDWCCCWSILVVDWCWRCWLLLIDAGDVEWCCCWSILVVDWCWRCWLLLIDAGDVDWCCCWSIFFVDWCWRCWLLCLFVCHTWCIREFMDVVFEDLVLDNKRSVQIISLHLSYNNLVICYCQTPHPQTPHPWTPEVWRSWGRSTRFLSAAADYPECMYLWADYPYIVWCKQYIHVL